MDSRLQLLIDAATKKGNPPNAQRVKQWKFKLENKIWIEGTPWNIPEDHRKAIISHFKNCVGL